MVLFDITWGETFVLTGLAFALIGRKDLPKVSHLVGVQVGRIVGFLQGVRVRADRFSEQHELRALHNELRSGLRELDAVRAELAIATSSAGLVGRGLTSTMSPRAAKNLSDFTSTTSSRSLSMNNAGISPLYSFPSSPESSIVSHSIASSQSPEYNSSHLDETVSNDISRLAPRSQSVAAVAEAEWEKRGIGFRSKAETGTSNTMDNADGPASMYNRTGTAGSRLLSEILQDSLIFDQYDRAMQEQEQALQKKVDGIRNKQTKGSS